MSRPTHIELPRGETPYEVAMARIEAPLGKWTVIYQLEPDRAHREVEKALCDWLLQRYHDPGLIVLGRRTYWSLCAWEWGEEKKHVRDPPWPLKLESHHGVDLYVYDRCDWSIQLLPQRGKEHWL